MQTSFYVDVTVTTDRNWNALAFSLRWPGLGQLAEGRLFRILVGVRRVVHPNCSNCHEYTHRIRGPRYRDPISCKPDGTERTVRFLLDTGSGGFLITEPLAREIGLTWGATTREEGAEFGTVASLSTVPIGAMPHTLNPERTLVIIGTDNILPSAALGDARMPG